MKIRSLLVPAAILVSVTGSMAQTAVHDATIIGPATNPHSSAVLDVKSTDKGVLVPNVDIANLATAAPVTGPAEGLLVYNTNITTGVGYYYWNGTLWTRVTSSGDQGAFWRLNGNTGTAVGTNYIGTSDNVGVAFRTDGTERMRLQSSGQLSIGATAAGAKLDVHQTTSTAVARLVNYANVPLLEIRRTGGTQASPTATSSTNTVLARIDGQGYNGAGFTSAARIEMATDATGGTSTDMPGRITFSTTPDASGTLLERMRISNNGTVQLNAYTTNGIVRTTSGNGTLTSGGAVTVPEGGTGATTLTGVVIGNGAAAMTAVAGTASQYLRRNAANTAYEFVALTPALVGMTNLTFNNGGAGAVSGTIYNGGTAQTISYNTIGAAPASGSGNYIQNQFGGAQSAEFRITGRGHVQGEFYYNGWLRHMGASQSGLYWQEGTGQFWHMYPANQQDMIFRTGSGNGGIMGTVGDATARGYVHWTNTNEIGFLNASRNWSLRVDNAGNSFHTASSRAPIFYDLDNTAFYLDPNGTSELNVFTRNTLARSSLNGLQNNSPVATRAVQADAYKNGAMGWGQVDFNVITNWGNGFIDTWSDPANAPGGSSHYTGIQSMHHTSQNSVNFYGFQMVTAGESVNRYFLRNSWNVPRPWVEMIHTGNIGSQGFIPNNGSGDWQIASNSNATGYSNASLELRETNFAGAGQQPPRLGFHWGGVVASQISIESDGTISIRNNPGTGYEKLRCLTMRSNGFIEPSDERLKKNISGISGALDKILSLRGVTYNWNKSLEQNFELTDGLQYGLIAQELEKVIPELVNTDAQGWKGVEYSHLVPILIEALKEQQSIINRHEATIGAQQQYIDGNKDDISFLKQYTKDLEARIEGIVPSVDGLTTGNK